MFRNYEVCPTPLYMARIENRTPDLLHVIHKSYCAILMSSICGTLISQNARPRTAESMCVSSLLHLSITYRLPMSDV